MKVFSAERLKLHAFIWLLLAIINIVGKLVDSAGNRVLFLVGADSSAEAVSAAHVFSNKLKEFSQEGSKAFKQVFIEAPSLNVTQIIDYYLPFRYMLLSTSDRSLFSEDTVNLGDRLQQKLYAPFRIGLSVPIEKDPFGFTDNWFASLPIKNFKLEVNKGLLVAKDVNKTWVFISAIPSGSAYNDVTQKNVNDAVKIAETTLKESFSRTVVLRTGALFYASAARMSAEKEVSLIGFVSLVGMLILLYLVFRSMRPLLLGSLSVGFGISTALAVTILFYGEIHLITLVFGASLIGETIDYAIQYFAAHLGAGEDWDPVNGIRRITPALTLALLTSLLGYCVLAFTPFPGLAQIAFFALIGLSSSWVSVYLLLPATLTKANQQRLGEAVILSQRLLIEWQRHVTKRICFISVFCLLVISIPGLFNLSGDDDIRLLVNPPADLLAQENKIREVSGIGNNSQFFLVEGTTQEAVLESEEELVARLDILASRGDISSYTALSSFVPSAKRQLKNRGMWKARVFANETKLKEVLLRAGLRDEVAYQLIDYFNSAENNVLSLDKWLQTSFSLPFRSLWLGKTVNHTYASVVLPHGITNHQALAELGRVDDSALVTYVDKAASVSTLFHDYRYWSSLWLVGAILIICATLSARYGFKMGCLVLMPAVLSITFSLSLLGHLNIPLSLFNMMGFMLVLGVGVNYAIFMREGFMLKNSSHQAASLAGVMLSSGTTLLSFGMLSLSSMPALASFGLTMLIGVGIAAPLSFMVLSFDK